MRWCDRGRQHINPSNLKGHIENGSPLPCPAPGPVLRVVLDGSSFVAESAEVSAGRSAFPCSAAFAAAAGSEPCLEAVRFRPSPAGACGRRVWAVRLGSVRVSWGARSSGLGESLLSDWHRVLRLVIARDGGRCHMRPVTSRISGDGLMCREPTPQIVADVSPRWGGQASIGPLE